MRATPTEARKTDCAQAPRSSAREFVRATCARGPEPGTRPSLRTRLRVVRDPPDPGFIAYVLVPKTSSGTDLNVGPWFSSPLRESRKLAATPAGNLSPVADGLPVSRRREAGTGSRTPCLEPGRDTATKRAVTFYARDAGRLAADHSFYTGGQKLPRVNRCGRYPPVTFGG